MRAQTRSKTVTEYVLGYDVTLASCLCLCLTSRPDGASSSTSRSDRIHLSPFLEHAVVVAGSVWFEEVGTYGLFAL